MCGGGISETMSDGDAEQMQQTGGNMMASGNVNKFYDAGWEHNMRNNLQLQKQYLEVECQGLNLAVMRGEKIPAMILDNDKLNSSIRYGESPSTAISQMLYEEASGWFIIDALMWKWERDDEKQGSTYWTTKLKLTRREWPIPGRQAVNVTGTDDIVNQATVNTTSSVADNTPASQNTEEQKKPVEGTSAEEPLNNAQTTPDQQVPTEGLRDFVLNVWNTVKTVVPSARLVSGKRWAVDENGKRVEGNAFVRKNGLYKCCNAVGDIMYFSSPSSPHLYGSAIDIINGADMSFDKLWGTIIQDPEILKSMADNGVAPCVETTDDDLGMKTKHIHIGNNPEMAKKFWKNMTYVQSGVAYLFANWQSALNRNRTTVITHEVVDEA